MSADPISMAIMGGSALASGFGAYTSASAQEQASKYNAGVLTQQARLAVEQAGVDARALERENRDHVASARAAYGASGFTLDASALDVLEDEAARGAYAAAAIRYRGAVTASGLRQQAALEYSKARSAGSAKYISALASFASTASQGLRFA